jgi:phosphatidylglycerol:prolipoprotein diacylglycerol transferase
MIALGLLVGVSVILHEGKKQKISEDFLVNLIFLGTLLAIFGGRFYYVIFNWSYYQNHFIEIFEIWNGGMAIHGAIIGGGLFTVFYSKNHNVNILKIVDIIVVGLIIGQVIGRWGNFFNQEAYGSAVSLDFLKGLHLPGFIIDGMKIGNNYYHPTFLYESLWNIIGFIILLVVRRFRYIHLGQITSIYMMWYGVGRFLIEILRTDSLMLGTFKVAQIISIIMVLFGLGLFIFMMTKSRFEYRYNEDETISSN